MILNIAFFGLILTTAFLPITVSAECYWGIDRWCVTLLGSILWFIKDSVNDMCCAEAGKDEIQLCSKTDLQGNCTIHRVPAERCVQMNTTELMVKSLNTFGHCFRLYDREDCTGESVGVQPGSGNHNDFWGFLSGKNVTSISRCFRSDLCVIRKEKSIEYRIGCHWPNDRLYHGMIDWLPYDFDNLGDGPIKWYQTGRWANRTDSMYARIYTHHIKEGPPVDEAVRKFVEEQGHPGDNVGYILPRRFSGSGADYRNVYPQSSSFKTRKWSRLEKKIEDIVRQYGSIFFTVNLQYHLATDTRPYLFMYRVRAGNSSELIIINDLVNPQRE